MNSLGPAPDVRIPQGIAALAVIPNYFSDCFRAERMPWFHNKVQVNNISLETAFNVIRAARRLLILTLMYQELHEHVTDDCGDYLTAATDNWHRLHHILWDNDVREEEVIAQVKEFLLEPASEWLASDGEIRFAMFSDEYQEASYGTDA